MLGRLFPSAGLTEPTVGADGVYYRLAGDRGAGGLLDYVFQGVADVAAALIVEAYGEGMMVEAGARGQAVVFHDVVGVEPVDEGFLDGLAFRVFADHAFAGVTSSRGGR